MSDMVRLLQEDDTGAVLPHHTAFRCALQAVQTLRLPHCQTLMPVRRELVHLPHQALRHREDNRGDVGNYDRDLKENGRDARNASAIQSDLGGTNESR